MDSGSHISLLALQRSIQGAIANAFELPVWVSAEISELKVNAGSGHCYMELVEKGGPDSIPQARCSAVIWRSRFASLASYFELETGSCLSAGLKVLFKASVSYHPLYGLSLTILDIDPAYTLGDWQQQKLQTIEMLRRDGVFDMNRLCTLPPDTLRIAVVSSATAAGFQDFRKQILASGFGFAVELFDAYVQGHGAEESVIAALERIALRSDDFDAVAIIRGGGSQSDLSCFNSYRLCSHIAQFPLPVLTGIGHDKDTSVADMVAYGALKTPTAVAAFFVDRISEQNALLDTMSSMLAERAGSILHEAGVRTENAAMRLRLLCGQMTRNIEIRLERLAAGTERLSQALLAGEAMKLKMAENRLGPLLRTFLKREGERLLALEKRVDMHRVENILSLGFAVVRDGRGAIYDAIETDIGQEVDITLARGMLRARITDNGKKQDIR